MLKQLILFTPVFFSIVSCTKNTVTKIENESYVLNIIVENKNSNKAYLYKLSTPLIRVVDSVIVKNDSAVFTGNIESPERFLITINDVFGEKMVIIENDTITIDIENEDISNSKIIGSPINDALSDFQKKSKKITSKIDLLFPEIQYARLENNAVELLKISNQVNAIVQENIDFNFRYIEENPNSYISAMILNDLTKRDAIDVNKISKYYELLNKNISEGIDMQNVELFLKSVH